MHSTDCLTNSNSCSPVPSSLWKFAGESESCWDKWTKPAQHEVRNRREDKLKFKQTSPVLSRCKMGCLSDSFVSAADRLYNAAFPLLPPLTRRELKNYKYRRPHFLISQFICWDSVLYMFVKILCVWLAHWVGCLSFHIPSCDRSISNAHTFLYLVSSCGTSRSWPSLFFVVMTFFFGFVLNYFNPKSHTHTHSVEEMTERAATPHCSFLVWVGLEPVTLKSPRPGTQHALTRVNCEGPFVAACRFSLVFMFSLSNLNFHS